jgi:ectoine hydroxylase-related dioxygenase (phytanoyl-CoA dioxygenase family)
MTAGAGHLHDAEQARYHAEGYLAPVPALAADRVGQVHDRVVEFIDEITRGDRPRQAAFRTKAHLHCAAVHELVVAPAIVEPVSDLLGPDLLCRSTSLFIKEPGDAAYVAWHQDAAYWELDPPDVATAWVALTESTVENGALRVIPRSHRGPVLPHGVIDDPYNMLSRGQAITAPVDEGSAVTFTLAPGEMSIHDIRLTHGSGPNRSPARRIGVAIRYVAAHVRKTGSRRDTATLVRGTDRYGNFDPEPAP